MTKKKNKAARKLANHEPEQPAPAYEQVDYGTPQSSDEEGETKDDASSFGHAQRKNKTATGFEPEFLSFLATYKVR